MVADTGGVLGQYERSSSEGSINYQSDIIEDTVASGRITSNPGVCSPSSYGQNRLLALDNDSNEGGISLRPQG